jgi:hypothetical protein
LANTAVEKLEFCGLLGDVMDQLSLQVSAVLIPQIKLQHNPKAQPHLSSSAGSRGA